MQGREDLLGLCSCLLDEKMITTSEIQAVRELNVEVEQHLIDLLKVSWVNGHQRLTLSKLIQSHPDSTPQNSCAQLRYYECATFVPAHKRLGSSQLTTVTALLRLLLNNSRLVAEMLNALDSSSSSSSLSDDVAHVLFCGLYGSSVFASDEKCLFETFNHLMHLQFSGCANPRRILRKNTGPFCRLYRLLTESLFSVKLFLTSALHEPILDLVLHNEYFLDIDPSIAVLRFPSSERISRFGCEGTPQYKENVMKHREFILHGLTESARKFISSLEKNLFCFPSAIAWLIQQLYEFLTRSRKVSSSETMVICTELVFTYFICPAIANPEPFGIVGDLPISYVARFNLMQVGQVLQTLAVWQWEHVDQKLMDLYTNLDPGSVSGIMDTILSQDSTTPVSRLSLDDIFPFDLKVTRHLSLLTADELDKLISVLKRVMTTALRDNETNEWQEVRGLLSNMPDNWTCANATTVTSTSMSPAHDATQTTAAAATSPDSTVASSHHRAHLRFPRNIGTLLVKSRSDPHMSQSGSAPYAQAGSVEVLMIPLGNSPEPVGLLPEDKVIEMMKQEKADNISRSCHEKRTRFSLVADSDSVGASDRFDAASDDQQSVCSSAEQITNPDMATLNDNFSDVDVLPISANVSGRASPDVSGRDTPSSSHIGDQDTTQSEDRPASSIDVDNSGARLSSLQVAGAKEAAIEEKFGKFEIPPPIRERHRYQVVRHLGDETHSMVSDSWSTDVLASDSEFTVDLQALPGAMVPAAALPDIIPEQPPEIPRLDLIAEENVRKISNRTSEFVPCDRSDTWSVDAVASDSETEPVRPEERLNEFDEFRSDFLSVQQKDCQGLSSDFRSDHRIASSSDFNSSVVEDSMNHDLSESSFHSDSREENVEFSAMINETGQEPGPESGSANVSAGAAVSKGTTSDCSWLSEFALGIESKQDSGASPAEMQSNAPASASASEDISDVRNLRDERDGRVDSADHAAVSASNASSENIGDCSEKNSYSPMEPSTSGISSYQNRRDSLFKSLKLKSLKSKFQSSHLSSGVNLLPFVHFASDSCLINCEMPSKPHYETTDDILNKYRSPHRSVGQSSGEGDETSSKFLHIAQPDIAFSGSNSCISNRPYVDMSNLTICQAFLDTKRKLRMVLSSTVFDSLPFSGLRYGLSKDQKSSEDLIQLLQLFLSESLINEEKSVSAQLQDLLRSLGLFDSKGIHKLLRALHEEHRRRSAYLFYLQQSKLTLLRSKLYLEKLISRLQREQRSNVYSTVELCVRLYLEQRWERQIKSFVHEFRNLQAQDEKMDLLERLLAAIRSSMSNDSTWQCCSKDQIAYVELSVERSVVARVYLSAIYPNGEGDLMRDLIFHNTVQRLSEIITPNHKALHVPEVFHAECPWPSAQSEIAIINAYKTARDKLKCVVKCCQSIVHLLHMSSGRPPSADDVMPVLVFVIIKANPEALLSTIQYINGFYGKRIDGEKSYWWVQFCSAVEYIKVIADYDT
ncbi:unnamed protein product [Soboliphyme baturini]|uniref:Receptor-mediated endocytosis protein 6 n=1 Tax=Soboliphyme baturini TaxID=241478 RepID=A0A183IF81_9BILA|nr:unnamed protein product [Soboliphyme baturini]